MSVTVSAPTYAGFRTRMVAVDGAGPRIVLLHGFADSARTWEGLLDRFAAAGRAAVAVDLPGFGEAERLAPQEPMITQLDAFVADLVADQSDRGEVVLVGNSLGASLALRAASRQVPCAAVVTLAEPTMGDSWLLRRMKSSPVPLLVRLLVLPVPMPFPLSRRVWLWTIRRVLFAQAESKDRTAAERFADFFRSQGGRRWIVKNARRIARELEPGYDADAITCPTLVVHGGKDRVIPPNGAHALSALLPDCELVVDDRWGHCPQLDDPHGVSVLLLDFLDDQKLSARSGSGSSEEAT